MAESKKRSDKKGRKHKTPRKRLRRIVDAAASVPGEDLFQVIDGQVRFRNKDMCFAGDNPNEAPLQTLLTAHALEGGRHALTSEEVAQAIAKVLNEKSRQ